MSILIPSVTVFRYIQDGLRMSAYRTTVDQFYSQTVRTFTRDLDPEAAVEAVVRHLIALNERSYNARYKETDEGGAYGYIYKPQHTINACQLLKYCQCVRYNIEMTTITAAGLTYSTEERKALTLLEGYIQDLMSGIINTIPEYKAASWA